MLPRSASNVFMHPGNWTCGALQLRIRDLMCQAPASLRLFCASEVSFLAEEAWEAGEASLSSKRMSVVLRGMMVGAVSAAMLFGSFEIAPGRAAAQCTMPSPTCSQVSPDGKGMVGLGLIGLEIGFIVPALIQEAAGTNEWWPYLVFPAVGAVGGIVGGYFMEQETRNSPEIDVAFLAVGMALVVPTVVATLALTAYEPGQEASGQVGGEEPDFEDETTTEAVQDSEFDDEASEPAPEPSTPSTEGGESSLRSRTSRLLAGGPGILRFDGQGRQVLLGVPMISRRSTFTAEETEALNLPPTTDVHVPLVTGTF